MKNRLITKLTSGRFLITIILTLVFGYLAIVGSLNSEFITLYTMIIAFYFGKDRLDNTKATDNKDL